MAQIFAKYPHFGDKFLYKPFSSGLTNIRVKLNKEVTCREEYAASGGVCESPQNVVVVAVASVIVSIIILAFTSDEGIRAHACASPGLDRYAPDDDEEALVDDLSRSLSWTLVMTP
jgi:hypothetical protein